eukprot:5690825-Amphidinium_carterae.1
MWPHPTHQQQQTCAQHLVSKGIPMGWHAAAAPATPPKTTPVTAAAVRASIARLSATRLAANDS